MQQKALRLCGNICTEAPQLCPAIAQAGNFAPGLTHCLSSQNDQVREAALALLVAMAVSPDAVSLLSTNVNVRQAYAGVKEGLQARAQPDADAACGDAAEHVKTIDAAMDLT